MDYTIIKAGQHQEKVRYGTFRGIQCSCMSLVSVSCTLFKSHGL